MVSIITPLDGVINTKPDKNTYLFTLLFWIKFNKTQISHVQNKTMDTVTTRKLPHDYDITTHVTS